MNTHLNLQLSLVSSRPSSAVPPTAPRPPSPRGASNVVELAATPFDRTVLAASFGDRKAIDVLARSHHRELVEHARRACEDQHDAEDAVQEFWLALLEKRLTRFPPETGRSAEWMRGVVECLALGQRIERWYAMGWDEASAKEEV
jgi:hypothetical protein